MTKTLNPADLHQFTGSETWYRHALNRKILFTDGAKYVADTAGAFWLLDEIASAQRYSKKVAATRFQVWKLTVRADRTATLTRGNSNRRTVEPKELTFTDFPDPGIELWFTDNTILLPSEY